jgi:hypothetical protein
MPATVTSEPRTYSRHPQRPWRPVASQPARPRRLVEHRFAAPVVRELPPRHELRGGSTTW